MVRPPLTRGLVIGSALELADREGLQSVSMRRLAAELGVEAMSLYHHVADKSDLLDALVDAVLDEMELPRSGAWRDRVAAISQELRRVCLAHEAIQPLVMSRGLRRDSVLRPADALLGALRAGGMDEADSVRAFWTVLAFVTGSIACQLSERPDGGAPTCVVPPETSSYTNVDAVAATLFTCDFDAQFSFGLHALIRSISD